PSVRSVCDRRDYFSAFEGGRDKRPRLDGKIRSTAGEEDFCGPLAAAAGIGRSDRAVYLCGKMQSPTGRTRRTGGTEAIRGRRRR
ncbi:hypothetical protein, partial [Bacteroides caccae]|uniref:hypothetical protein n=1 Tax=Bacteroides caccae TaxID=47678 RepID=UPI001484F28F